METIAPQFTKDQVLWARNKLEIFCACKYDRSFGTLHIIVFTEGDYKVTAIKKTNELFTEKPIR